MADSAGVDRKAVPADRRMGKDRRKQDLGPPGRLERRRSVESRQPDVSEIEMSASDWGALEQVPAPAKK